MEGCLPLFDYVRKLNGPGFPESTGNVESRLDVWGTNSVAIINHDPTSDTSSTNQLESPLSNKFGP